MRPLKTLAALVLLALPLTIIADSNRGELRGIMQQLADGIIKLMPIVHDKQFDREAFTRESANLKNWFDQAESHFDDQPIGARITYQMLQDRLARVEQLSEDNSVLSARALLGESMELCASCHTQDHKKRRGFGISRLEGLNEFQAAEFSYLSRDYHSALVSYRNYLDTEKTNTHQRSLALDRILTIAIELNGDPEKAEVVLNDLTLIDQSERHRVASWQSVFNRLGDSLVSPLGKTTADDMDAFLTGDWPELQSFLDWNEQQAYWMLIRRQLNDLLSSATSEADIPKLLYWLAVADRSTHFMFYESLSRRYLESCIREYSDHPYARRCFDEFELLMIVTFSGSGGVNVPVEIRQEINELRQVVYGN